MRFSSVVLALLAAAACGRTNNAAVQQSVAAIAARIPASPNDGGRVYVKNCSSCHQADGRGVPDEFPPLAGSPLVVGPAERVIQIVKLGMRGKMDVNGRRYVGTMPRWGQLISDEEIASVVSYIRTSWHNRAGPVTLADVRAVSP